jgi:hypothetical protein
LRFGGLLLPEAGFNDFDQPAPTLGRVEKADHYTEWIRCAKEGRPTCLPIEFASHLTELALLGTLALRTRKVLEWDGCYILLPPVTGIGFWGIFAPRLLPAVPKRLLSVNKLFSGLSQSTFPAPSPLRTE